METATIRENKPFSLLNPNQVYQAYNTQLSTYPRAVAVAKAYQLYRIKSITFVISPLADTFVAGNNTVPYLYHMIDRTKMLASVTNATQFKRLGAKPQRIDDKIVSFKLKPSVLVGTLDSAPPAGQSTTQFTQYKMSPWLSTRDQESVGVWNPDSTDHQGIIWLMESSGGNPVQYKFEQIVEFEFKKPALDFLITVGDPEPIDIDSIGLPLVEEVPKPDVVEPVG